MWRTPGPMLVAKSLSGWSHAPGKRHCVKGACVAGEDLICYDGNPCTSDGCEEGKGCSYLPDDQGVCADDEPCNGTEACVDGTCIAGQPPVCNDENPCTKDGCHPGLGCTYEFDDFQSCADGDVCNGDEICSQGDCLPGPPLTCDDGNPCTDDGCHSIVGCFAAPNNQADCDDGDECNGEEICDSGTCLSGDPMECNDGNPCTTDACITEVGCTYVIDDANQCSDGDFCNGEEVCLGGSCLETIAPNCDDGNPCTSDLCVSPSGCTYQPTAGQCSDEWACTEDSCDAGECKSKIASDYCIVADACVLAGTTDPADPCMHCSPLQSQIGWSPLEEGASCGGVATCIGGLCCDPVQNCIDKTCGDDGCGGVCGSCGCGEECGGGQCMFHGCDDKQCGDDGCSGSCGACGCGETCDEGACVFHGCDGKVCGDNGCNGTCGGCGCGEECVAGTCVFSACEDKQCGDDGCSGTCGTCSACGETCVAGDCVFSACEGKQCGDDGCGGECGVCGCGEECVAGSCVFSACDGVKCGDDGCGGSCGTCKEHYECIGGYCSFVPWCGDGNCDPTEDCSTCNEDCGECIGTACIEAQSCESGYCVNGRCCQNSCNGICRRCDISGHLGTCTYSSSDTDPDSECGLCRVCDGSGGCKNVANNTDPKNQCPALDKTTCSYDGYCTGLGTCGKWSNGTICKGQSCSGSTLTKTSHCDGFGTCVPGPTQSCCPYKCSGNQMCGSLGCGSDSQCCNSCDWNNKCK